MNRIPKIIDFNTQNEANNFFEEAPEGYYLYRVKSKPMFSRVSMVHHKLAEPFNITIASNANITVNNGSSGGNHLVHATFEYSYDKSDWKEIANNTPTQFQAGKIYFRNTKDDDTSWDVVASLPGSGYKTLFDIDTKYTISGHICSLMGKTGYKTMTPKSCQGLFHNDISLAYIDDLILPNPGTNSVVYIGMFDNCTGLNTVKMDISQLDRPSYMFYQCTSLVNVSGLKMPNTLANQGCQQMFYGCTALVSAPALPATTLATNCYASMFYGCTSLVNAPALPATTCASYCYSYMFYGCTALVSAPALPATTLDTYCYQYMFQGCSKLVNAPTLSATTLANYCYRGMFYGCTSLVNAPALPATTLAQRCYVSMFNGCTALVSAPALPATTLYTYCYSYMFNGCSALRHTPILPATTLATYCYQNMFMNCPYVEEITSYASNISASGCLTYWLSGASPTGIFHNLGGATYPRSLSGIPANWTEVFN